MSGSYDECAGADDTMDSFWEVRSHRHVCSDGFSTSNPSPYPPQDRVTTETMKIRFVFAVFVSEVGAIRHALRVTKFSIALHKKVQYVTFRYKLKKSSLFCSVNKYKYKHMALQYI